MLRGLRAIRVARVPGCKAFHREDLTPEQAPAAEEVREALHKILASPAFAHAPQLGAFLRFVVESVLAGRSEYIKGYTIAVEALGRPESFDPKTDPIVRVEAGRVRRALSRYYADGNAEHAVLIELPLGTYVPVFSRLRRHSGATAPFAGASLRFAGSALSRMAVAAGLLVAVAAGFSFAMRASWIVADPPEVTDSIKTAVPPFEFPAGSFLPLVTVEPFAMVGASPQQAAELDAFRFRLRDALSRFDEVDVASDGTQPARAVVRSRYRLAGLAQYNEDGSVSVTLRLDHIDDGTITWTQTFEIGTGDARSAFDTLAGRVATKLAQPYGVIYAEERADDRADPRYRCLIDVFEFRRGFKRIAAAEADACLERVTRLNPTFAQALALKALRTLHRYYDWQGDAAALLDQALALAQKAVDLKPQSARARQALMTVLLARRDIPAALHEGEVAIALNPDDMLVLHSYSLLLLISGQPEKGAAMIREAAERTPVRPAMFEFAIFLGAYLLGDDQKAADAARLSTNDDYQLLLVARAVSALRAGNPEQSQRAIERLLSRYPGWRDNPRKRLERYFPSSELVDRLMGDLERAGLLAAL